MAPFVVSAANGCFDGTLDVPQHLPAHVTDGSAEGKNGIRGRKIVDCLEIILVKVAVRLKTTALQNRIQDTDGSCTFELELLSGFIIIHQERTVNDGESVTTVVVPIRIHQLARQIGNLLAESFVLDTVFSGKHF